MGFWIFMLVMDLLVPAVMILLGGHYAKNAPKEINAVSGYRTTMSMKNKDTWEFAHHYCGKIWRTVGWGVLILSFVAMLFVFGKDVGTVGIVGGILCGVQAVFLCSPILPTEIALRKTFDENGNRK